MSATYAELRAAYLPPMPPRRGGVAALLADGLPPVRIAPAMGLTVRQVHSEIDHLCCCLGCTRRDILRRLRGLLA